MVMACCQLGPWSAHKSMHGKVLALSKERRRVQSLLVEVRLTDRQTGHGQLTDLNRTDRQAGRHSGGRDLSSPLVL